MPAFFDRTLRTDALIAFALTLATAITQIPAAGNQGVLFHSPTGFAIIGATGMVLTIRRKWPLTCLILTFAGSAVYITAGFPYGPIFLLIAVAMCTVANEKSYRVTVVTCAILFIADVPVLLYTREEDEPAIVNIAISATWLILPALTGMALRAARLARRKASVEERGRYLADERLRIAREVHDVVGHSLAVISMHAGVALHVIDRRGRTTPSEVIESLRTIRASGHEALEELRATLARLSTGDTLGLEALPELVTRVSSPDMSVSLDVHGERPDVPPTVDGAAYRIAQEAVTNVVRHAKARTATVVVTYARYAVNLVISDDGRGHDGDPDGNGLSGMRARVEALDGVFATGPSPTGGFQVRARLPYDKVDA